MEAPALFPRPEPQIPPLSTYLSVSPHWRVLPGETATWTRLRVTTLDCQECAHVQHEMGGAFGPRRQAKRRRSYDGTRLDLCHAHALAWQERDEADSGVST